MSHRIIILDKSKTFGAALGDAVSLVSRADALMHESQLSNHSQVDSKIDQISDFLSDYASDLAGLVADLEALLPSED